MSIPINILFNHSLNTLRPQHSWQLTWLFFPWSVFSGHHGVPAYPLLSRPVVRQKISSSSEPPRSTNCLHRSGILIWATTWWQVGRWFNRSDKLSSTGLWKGCSSVWHPMSVLYSICLSRPVFVPVSVMCHVSYLWKPRVQFIGVVASSDWPRAEQWVCMHGSHGVQWWCGIHVLHPHGVGAQATYTYLT